MRRYLYPLFTFFALFFVSEVILLNIKYINKQKQTDVLNSVGFSMAQNIQEKITMGIFSTRMLETMLKIENFNTNHFDDWAMEIKQLNHAVRVVQLAKNGIISHVYPFEENKIILGHNLLSDEKRKRGALKALAHNDIIFVGPIKLIQDNKLAMIARKPITKNGAFWGFSISIIYIEDLVKNLFDNSLNKNVSYSLSTSNPDFPKSNIISQSENFQKESSYTYSIEIPNGKWYLSLNYFDEDLINETLLKVFIFLVAFVFALIIYKMERKSYLQALKLEKLNYSLEKLANTDPLTKIANRRNATQYAKNQLSLIKRENKEFSICYVDIDHFKKVNDKYGHDLGDLVLIHFTELFSNNIRKADFFARWGGEEFLIILPFTNIEGAKILSENLRKLISENPLKINDKNLQIDITVSMGITSLKNNDESLDDLLNRADKALYKAKFSGRNKIVQM